jgi:hypothetical protein
MENFARCILVTGRVRQFFYNIIKRELLFYASFLIYCIVAFDI